MRVVLLRVGIDTGVGGIDSPLFADGSFEFVPLPDRHQVNRQTYGNTTGRHGRPLSAYFPRGRQAGITGQSIHADGARPG